MTDHHGGDPGPGQMAQADIQAAQRKAAEAKADEAIAGAFDAQGDVFAAIGFHDAANQAYVSAGNEREAAARATTEALAHGFAAYEWSEAGHDLREQAKLTGEGYAAGARAHEAQSSLDRGGDLDDARRTELELEARTEAARQGVFVERAGAMGAEAAEDVRLAEGLDQAVHAMEEADQQ